MALFDQTKCPVSLIPEVDFHFVSDCSVLPAPPPIFDCPEVNIPFDVPQQKIPCPAINVSAAGGISYGTDPCAEPRFTVVVTTTQRESCGSCALDIDLDFDIDIPPPKVPCPELAASGALTVTTGTEACETEPSVIINVTNTTREGTSCGSSPTCEFNFDFDFNIPIPPPPCPDITGSAAAIITIGENPTGSLCRGEPAARVNLTVTTNNTGTSCNPQCEVDFDFDFDFVLPRPVIPCPTIGGSATATIDVTNDSLTCTGDPTVDVALTVTTNQTGDSCNPTCEIDFDFDFDFVLPRPVIPCPTIGGSATATIDVTNDSLTCTGDPTVDVALTVTTNQTGDSCNPTCEIDFDFDFDFVLPRPVIPCPTIGGSATATIDVTNDSLTCTGDPTVDVALTVTTNQTGDSCNPTCEIDFDFDFDFVLPRPVIPCPEIYGFASATVNVNRQSSASWQLSNSSDSANWLCGIDPSVDVALTVTTNQTGDSCNPQCEVDFDFDFDFVIPNPIIPCPTINGSATIDVNYIESDLPIPPELNNVTLTVTNQRYGDPCNPECIIDLDFDFEIAIPINTSGHQIWFEIIEANCIDEQHPERSLTVIPLYYTGGCDAIPPLQDYDGTIEVFDACDDLIYFVNDELIGKTGRATLFYPLDGYCEPRWLLDKICYQPECA
jgi:hypothetical protein